jgi:hypothetical protein
MFFILGLDFYWQVSIGCYVLYILPPLRGGQLFVFPAARRRGTHFPSRREAAGKTLWTYTLNFTGYSPKMQAVPER